MKVSDGGKGLKLGVLSSSFILFILIISGALYAQDAARISMDFQGAAPDIGWAEYPAGSPSVPSYVNAVIENAAPARLELMYNAALSNIIPAPSAFSVLVNSSARSSLRVSRSFLFPFILYLLSKNSDQLLLILIVKIFSNKYMSI